MDVIFDASIKMNPQGAGWYIELEDRETTESFDCEDLKVFETKLNELSEKYTGRVDEVRWSKDDNVTPFYLNEVRMGIIAMEEEIQKEKSEAQNAELK